VKLGLDVILAAWGCLLAQGEGGFGPRWHFGSMGVLLAQGEDGFGSGWQFGCMGVPFSLG
jgi:hypothetical protein